jgi:hypothetical protein
MILDTAIIGRLSLFFNSILSMIQMKRKAAFFGLRLCIQGSSIDAPLYTNRFAKFAFWTSCIVGSKSCGSAPMGIRTVAVEIWYNGNLSHYTK